MGSVLSLENYIARNVDLSALCKISHKQNLRRLRSIERHKKLEYSECIQCWYSTTLLLREFVRVYINLDLTYCPMA